LKKCYDFFITFCMNFVFKRHCFYVQTLGGFDNILFQVARVFRGGKTWYFLTKKYHVFLSFYVLRKNEKSTE